MRVLKFGGTSVGSPDRMKNVLNLLQTSDEPQLVVLSAMSGTTNCLKQISTLWSNEMHTKVTQEFEALREKYVNVVLELYETEEGFKNGMQIVNKYFKELHQILRAKYSFHAEKQILAFGELLSTSLFQVLCEECGEESTLLSAFEIMKIDNKGCPDYRHIDYQLPRFVNEKKGGIYILQGYICRNPKGEADNLGRGGSDYTATIVGSLLKAKEIQIWTDIDGIHNNDPRFVSGTTPVSFVSYEAASKLAYFGAKILHPLCVTPAKEHEVPIRIKNTFAPEMPGTVISDDESYKKQQMVSAKDNVSLLTIHSNNKLATHAFVNKVFDIVHQHGIVVDMVSVAHESVSLVINDDQNGLEAIKELEQYGWVNREDELTIVNVVCTEHLPEVYRSIQNFSVKMLSQCMGNCNYLLLLVNTEQKGAILRAIHDETTGNKKQKEMLPLAQ